ncbi:hypothetical protein DUI87_13190 [Hirundo rustica rustica]|uniref:Uncharacterized protein n=1 Tax=Hirundo rustica rustica TaxID=333673 RepID=A0A3M0KB01_HIRRU|nr:hypothetical protein DUI87_13190 [Hirundo rustica rustica]
MRFLLLNCTEYLVMKDVEKDEVSSVVFALVFTGKTGLQQYQVPEASGKSLERERITLREEGPDKGTLKQLWKELEKPIHKSSTASSDKFGNVTHYIV